MPNKEDFIKEIQKELAEAKRSGNKYIDLIALDIHKAVGYDAHNHRMRTCCDAMYSLMKPEDDVVFATASGYSSTLRIRYFL